MLIKHLHGKWAKLFILGGLTFGFVACQTTKHEKKSGKSDKAEAPSASEDKGKKEKDEEEEVFVAGSLKTMTYSANNNPMTSKTVDKGKAKSIADSLENSLKNPEFKDRQGLIGLMAAKRFADLPLEDVYKAAQKLINVEMKKDIRREMPEVANLELALTALRSGKLTLAEHFLGELSDNKNKNIIAAVHTAEGMIAQMDDRLPEAVAFWEEALKAIPEYQPAMLNIGFTALRFGDYKTALKMLEPITNDWFALTGVLIAERLGGNSKRVAALCSRINSMKEDYKPAMLSCALNEYQGMGNYPKAKEILKKLVKTKGGSPVIDEKAYRVISAMEDDERKSKEEAAKKKEDAIKKQEAAKEAKANKGGGGAGKEKEPKESGQAAPSAKDAEKPAPAESEGGGAPAKQGGG